MITNIEKEILKNIENEFDELKGVTEAYSIDYNHKYWLDFFVVDHYIFKEKLDGGKRKEKYKKLLYGSKNESGVTSGQRYECLIEFLRKNKHMIGIWML